jgi:hypothetical protein
MTANIPNNTSATQNFFNGYYSQSIPVDSAVYDRVLSFFKTKTTSLNAAEQLTQNVIALTYKNKLDPIAVINDFDKATTSSDFKLLFIRQLTFIFGVIINKRNEASLHLVIIYCWNHRLRICSKQFS